MAGNQPTRCARRFVQRFLYYDPRDMEPYRLVFATQHVHLSEKERLIEYAAAFAKAEKAAIEFYENGRDRFGGDLETALLNKLSYDSLRSRFGYPSVDISGLTFQVRAWDKEYRFDGAFIKDPSGTVQIVRKYVEE